MGSRGPCAPQTNIDKYMSVVHHRGSHRHNYNLRQLGSRAATHIAGRAINSAYHYGKRKLEEAVVGYMKNGHASKKRLIKSHKIKGHREAPVIDSVELEATGVMHESFTYSNKIPKKAGILQALSRPVIHRESVSAAYSTGSGECVFRSLATAQRTFVLARVLEAITQTIGGSTTAAIANTQVLYKTLKFKRTVTNSHNEPCWVLWHEFMPMRTQPNLVESIANTQVSQESNLISSGVSGNGINFPDTDILKYAEVRKLFKCVHRRKIYLKGGETCVFYSNYNMNTFVTPQFIGTDAIAAYVKGITPFVTYQLQGANACLVTAGTIGAGTVTLSRAKISVVEICTTVCVPYPLPTVKLDRFDTNNTLAVASAIGQTTHVNVDTNVTEVDNEA